jgi:uncharacterized repeat protein (TIGR03803 family)
VAPVANVVRRGDGSLYGTASGGGEGSVNGDGTVFRLRPPASGTGPWTLTRLYNFPTEADGASPQGDLTFDANGHIFSTTQQGQFGVAFGTIFRLRPPLAGQTNWRYTRLKAFISANGTFPNDGLAFNSNFTSLFGVAPNNGPDGHGTVFRLNRPTSGTLWPFSVIHSFPGNDVSFPPNSRLAVGSAGALYGVAESGNFNKGSVFRLLPPSGSRTTWLKLTLHTFTSGAPANGATPLGRPLLRGVWVYGTTRDGGNGFGTVFRVRFDGTGFQVLHRFTGGLGGAKPLAGLVADGNGRLYGTTSEGGNGNRGTVFRIIP